MKKYLPTLLLILVGCSQQPTLSREESFTKDITELRDYFHIPGIAVIVTKEDRTIYESYLGFADLGNKVPMDSTTVIPMASLTKMFTGYLMLRLHERNVFDQSINKYVTDQNIPDSIKVKHVLSHTSQGEVGKHFYYSSRFSWLTKVIEKEYGASFDQVVSDLILVPYAMSNTFLLNDTSQLIGKKIAMPYFFEGETKPGFIDYGFSASSGITSTVRDMAKFGPLVFANPNKQYDYGYFQQEIDRQMVYWAYGQYDCYSSLFIRVPSKRMTLVLAANNSLASDPARLIYGDVRKSLFALSFFRNFLDITLPRQQLKARAVAESYLGRYDQKRAEKSKELLREVFNGKKDYYGLTTMHNIAFLKEIAVQTGQPNFTEFDVQLKEIGDALLSKDVNNPYANIYMASCYQFQNDIDSARIYYTRVAEAKNFARSWYTSEAENWLRQHASTSGPGTSTPLPK